MSHKPSPPATVRPRSCRDLLRRALNVELLSSPRFKKNADTIPLQLDQIETRGFQVAAAANKLVEGLQTDSRKVQSQDLFFAIRGVQTDSHQFLPEVCAKEPIGVVVEDRSLVPESYSGVVLVVPDTRMALSTVAAEFYDHPSRDLFVAGVTGTNGKTSTTHIIEAILSANGQACGVMGTIDHHLNDYSWPTGNTTPDPITVHQRLRQFCDLGANAAAMEVTSHALHQLRAEHVDFDVAVFTNLTPDHLDYHKDMASYFAAKAHLFENLLPHSRKSPTYNVICRDDVWGQKLLGMTGKTTFTYGKSAGGATAVQSLASSGGHVAGGGHKMELGSWDGGGDFAYTILSETLSGMSLRIEGPFGLMEVQVPVLGGFNAANITAAVAVGAVAGLSFDRMIEPLRNFRGVPGRLQSVAQGLDRHVFVDYAHTEDSLEKTLSLLKSHLMKKVDLTKNKSKPKLICVFGCGGDRDKSKRPRMGRIATEIADISILTSDNPRTESPEEILDQVEQGIVPNATFERISDRAAAIYRAIELSQPGDVVVVAGKGHEDYQILGDTRIHFDDREVARTAIKDLGLKGWSH